MVFQNVDVVVVFFLVVGLFSWYWVMMDWLVALRHKLPMQYNHVLHISIGLWSIFLSILLLLDVSVPSFMITILTLLTGLLYYSSGLWDEWWMIWSTKKRHFVVLPQQLSRVDILHHNVETAYPLFELLLGGLFLSGSLIMPLARIFSLIPYYGQLLSILCFFLLFFLLFLCPFILMRNKRHTT
jgi:hypothetical protein